MEIDVLADLEALLYHQDEVQIPSLGVISTRQNDFSIDRRAGILYPSAKRVHTFDRIIHTNNNALVNFIAQKYGMSYDEAHQAVQAFADNHADTLKSKGLTLPSIGKLSIDDQGRVQFEPNQVNNYSIENYGLPILEDVHPVIFERQTIPPKIEQSTNGNVSKEIINKKEQALIPAKSYLQLYTENRLLQLLTIIILLLGTTIPLTQRYLANNQPSNHAGFNLSTNTTEQSTENTNEYDKNLDDDNGFVNTTSQENDPKETPIRPKPENVKIPISTPKSKEEALKDEDRPSRVIPIQMETHQIVLGAFGKKENADKLQLDIYSKGYKDVDITQLSNGIYRVAIVLQCPENEVNKKLKEIKKHYKSAYWKK